jgi:rhamnose utilization protein RhaD (predicted bifunctional aldolase and dehydrogenase)
MVLENLDALVAHSARIGSITDLVQSSGGNVSQKTKSTLWVKASGKYLKDAGLENIFTEVNIEDLTDEEILKTEDFSARVRDSKTPSIETNFHIILKKKYVTHLHSLGSISIGISEFSNLSIFANTKISFISYTRPGTKLAKAIHNLENAKENTLVLKNHGVIFSGETVEEIEDKIFSFEDFIRTFLNNYDSNIKCPNWIEILTSGVLTPDEAVFLGEVPFVSSDSSILKSIAINSKSELLFPVGFTQNQIDMANLYVKVAKSIEKKSKVSYIPQKEVKFLLNWEKEKIRILSSK